jgi:hypothetical protein
MSILVNLLKSVFGLGAASANHQGAIAGLERSVAIREDSRSAEEWYDAGLANYECGRYVEALQNFGHAIEIDSASGKYHYQAAATEFVLGNVETASKYCEAALERSPDLAPCHELMARIALPGPDYGEALSLIHQSLMPRTYVEIGVSNGQSLMLAHPRTRAIGIDPAPTIGVALSENFTVHAMTSDDYFATHDVVAELGGLPIELAFIDGRHLFEYALRDFANIEKHCTPQSTVLAHDCYPLNRRTAERSRVTNFWSGDCWRLILALKKYRPDLQINTIATAPTGLAVVRNLDPRSSVLSERMNEIVAEFLAVDYAALDSNKPGMLNRFPNDVAHIRALLPGN